MNDGTLRNSTHRGPRSSWCMLPGILLDSIPRGLGLIVGPVSWDGHTLPMPGLPRGQHEGLLEGYRKTTPPQEDRQQPHSGTKQSGERARLPGGDTTHTPRLLRDIVGAGSCKPGSRSHYEDAADARTTRSQAASGVPPKTGNNPKSGVTIPRDNTQSL